MDIQIIKANTGSAQAKINGKTLLSVVTNLNSKIYKQVSMQDLLSEPGIMINDTVLNEWECSESFEYEGKLIFPGPMYEGSTLANIDPDLEILLNLTNSFQRIIVEKFPLDGFYSPGVFKTSEGGILFFPPKLINFLSSQLSDEESLIYWQPYNHPDAKGEQKYSFILAVLAYKLLTGSFPYTGTTLTEIREKMRKSSPVGIELLAPGIKDSIANLINKALSLKDTNLKEWTMQLGLWKEEGAMEAVDKEKLIILKETAEKKQKKRENKFARNQFFSHNWKTIGIIIIVLIVVLPFIIGPIKKSLEPPVTLGMSPIEVVNLYYKSYTDMDVDTMEDCVQKGTAKNDIAEITQMYVISKVRTGYEGKSGLISAQDWSDGKITSLKEGDQIAGIANLKITKLKNNEYQADYTRWYPNIPDDSESKAILPPIKVTLEDTLVLEKIKDVWTIVKLDRKKEE